MELSPNAKDRFMLNVAKAKMVDGCLLWPGYTQKHRDCYGTFRLGGRGTLRTNAHRVSYAIANNDFNIEGYIILHSCDNPRCIKPSHLTKGSFSDNMNDMYSKGRQNRVMASGEKSGRSKLTNKQASQIRMLKGRTGWADKDIAEVYSVGKSTISKIISGKTYVKI